MVDSEPPVAGRGSEGALAMSKPVALVSGVGPGTGASIVRRFASGGYRVAMLARSRERLDSFEREIPETLGVTCDVADEAQVESALASIRAELGDPEILIHYAVGGSFGS